jgi:translation initiation factor IF-1
MFNVLQMLSSATLRINFLKENFEVLAHIFNVSLL